MIRPRHRRRGGGFTLLEVMIGLAILGFALTVLIKSAARSITSARSSQMLGVATDLSRGKMYDLEEMLLKEGFTDTDQAEDGTFDDEGWPNIKYSYKIEEIDLPSFEQLQAMAAGKAAAAGSGSAGSGSAGEEAADPLASFNNSLLGGAMASEMAGDSGIEGAAGTAMMQGLYPMFRDILKVSIRKVTLVVEWDVAGDPRDMTTVAFFTDSAAMDKVLQGLGSQELPDDPAGAGSGSAGRGARGTTGRGSASGGGGR